MASCYRSPDASGLAPDAQPDAATDGAPDSTTDGSADSSPDSTADASPDGTPDATPDASPDAPTCTESCSANHTQFLGCNGNTPALPVTCGAGCGDSPAPHCLLPTLSNNVEAGIPAGVLALTKDCGGDSLLFMEDGKVTQGTLTIRSAGAGLVNGIGFHTVGSLSVFSFASLEMTNCAIASNGNLPLALVSLSSMRFDQVHFQFAGSLSNAHDAVAGSSCSDGGSVDGNGGGGAGASTAGANGADFSPGGGICATPFSGPKPGSFGGSGLAQSGGPITSVRPGGPPGGALQLSARYTLQTSNVRFSFGGGGGMGAGFNQPAGGGGSGGTLLVEAHNVSFAGDVFANGGGGGGVINGQPANGLDGPDAAGPIQIPFGFLYGGAGSSHNGTNPIPAQPGTSSQTAEFRGGGGGGLGFLRFSTNSLSSSGSHIATKSQVALPLH